MDKKFLKTYFFCAAATLLIAFALWNYKDIVGYLTIVLRALRPIIIGAAIAFILNRPYERIKKILAWMIPKIHPRVNDIISLILLYLLALGIIAGIIVFIIPQLGNSVNLFVSNLNDYYDNIKSFTVKALNFGGHNWWEEFGIEQKLLDFAKELPTILTSLFTNIVNISSGIIGTVTDSIVGVVISIYALSQKKKLANHGKRILKAALKKKYYDRTIELLGMISDTFSSFISGQLTEALILGILCFIGMTVFGFKYAILISTITALFNLIPFVGPIIGAIPCAFILFLDNPIRAIWFIVFIIVLQQLESNIIYPRVVGNSVGLPAIWVLSAVVVSGSLFGILGMLLAIPTTSVIYELIRRWTNKKNGTPDHRNTAGKEKDKTIIIQTSTPPNHPDNPN